jgi:hypothetical protein
MASKLKFIKINGPSPSAPLATTGLFRESTRSDDSPIDIYVRRNKALILKIGDLESAGLLDSDSDDDSYIYNLFLLGFISNVESYFRSIIRELINIDSASYVKCLGEQVTYAAAIHHDRKLLPEALLEGCTFISNKNIVDSLKKFLDINIQANSNTHTTEVSNCLDLFEDLCHLRHCIVHRAGLLGSKNAIKLGMDEHKNYLEKPITLNLSFLQNASIICLNSVRTTNNLLFNRITARRIEKLQPVHWLYPKDKIWFKPYFDIFSSNFLNADLITSGGQPITSFQAYEHFRSQNSN